MEASASLAAVSSLRKFLRHDLSDPVLVEPLDPPAFGNSRSRIFCPFIGKPRHEFDTRQDNSDSASARVKRFVGVGIR